MDELQHDPEASERALAELRERLTPKGIVFVNIPVRRPWSQDIDETIIDETIIGRAEIKDNIVTIELVPGTLEWNFIQENRLLGLSIGVSGVQLVHPDIEEIN